MHHPTSHALEAAQPPYPAPATQANCPLCKSNRVNFAFTMAQTIDAEKCDVTIFRCGDCQTGFSWPRPTLEQLSRHYDSAGRQDPEATLAHYQHSKARLNYGGMKEAAFLLNLVQRLVPPPATLFDVACGHGWHLAAAKQAGYQAKGIEISTIALKVCREVMGMDNTEVQQGLFENFDIDAENENRHDVVLLSQVLEHTLDPLAWVEKAVRLTRSGGVVAIAVPNHDSLEARIKKNRYAFFCPPEHLNYFVRASLEKITEHAPLDLKLFATRNHFALSSLDINPMGRAISYGVNLATDKLLYRQGRYMYALFQKH